MDGEINKIFNAFDREIRINSVRAFGGVLYNFVYLVSASVREREESYILRVAPPVSVLKLFYEKKMIRSEPRIHDLVLSMHQSPPPQYCFMIFQAI